MQPIPSTPPTPAQFHGGQLSDFKQLLEVMRENKRTLADFAQALIKPSAFSPLYRANETGQRALQELIEDADYLALCEASNVSPHSLIVTATERSFIYEASSQDGAEKTELLLSANARWQAIRPRIEKSVLSLSGQLRGDGLVSAPRMATFYALAPWDPAQPAELQTAIDSLREKTASFQLGLEEDFDPLDLPLNLATENQQSILQGAPTADTQDGLRRQFVTGQIKKVMQTFLPDGITSPLTHLAAGILESVDLESVRAQPTAFLKKILQSAEGIKLGDHILLALQWYGGQPGEMTGPHIRSKVLATALQLWFKGRSIEHPDTIAGYALDASSNWGKSYGAIRREFEAHLLASKSATSEKEAIVLARLFLCQFPIEFRIGDIPCELSYRGSVAWVNFVTGVNLIQATEPESLKRMTFQQLIDIALHTSRGATTEHLRLIALARLAPCLAWAITQGVIASKSDGNYSDDQLGLALSSLDNHADELIKAVIQLDEQPPRRLEMAKEKMENILGQGSFSSDGRKLTRKVVVQPTTWRSTPAKEFAYYSFVDVYASGQFEGQRIWDVTTSDGHTVSPQTIMMLEDRTIRVSPPWKLPNSRFFLSPHLKLPDINAPFNSAFSHYLEKITAAYETLIRNLLASLPLADRQALELGKVSIYSLRKQTTGEEAQNETPEMILPLRSRYGVIIRATHQQQITSYELLPRAGMIRRLDRLAPELIGARKTTERWKISKSGSVTVSVHRHKDLPFDWTAHSSGAAPQKDASCQAIIEQLGDTFASRHTTVGVEGAPGSLSSERTRAISKLIATELLFLNPEQLRTIARGQTQFELEDAFDEKVLRIVKIFIPFWSSIEDLASGDRKRLISGVFGLFIDLLSFAQPIGKLASGSVQLIGNAGRLTLRARVPAFMSLTKEVMLLTLRATNPLDGIGSLLRALGSKGLKLVKSSILKVEQIAGKAGHFIFVHSMPKINDVGRWRPLVSGDRLATVGGVDNILVRNLSPAGRADYRLIDPRSSRPFGPSLATGTDELSLGRSHYSALEKTDSHVVVELSENSHIREVFEVDGRTTLFIGDQPYRLKDDVLRRAALRDVDETSKMIPCRVPRAPGAGVCRTRYVLRDPAPTPDIGSFDNAKGWAPWFGDVIYSPAINRTAMRTQAIRAQSTLEATMEFQKGIYGRVMVSVRVPGQQLVDNFQVGSIIVEAIDGSKRYVFLRLNAGNFYVAERTTGQSVHDVLTFKQAETLPNELKNELMVVYTGSLNANNMVRIHGQASVERALRTMDEIAVPLGSHVNPPETLKWLKVDTSPGEAVLFDHSTRMIVRSSADGAATWSASRAAPDSVRETTAAIFNNLFQREVIKVGSAIQGGPKALKIDDTMRRLQTLISRKTGRQVHAPRNIAFAEIKTKAGAHEVYVSVSGNQGDTGFLPLFAKNRHTNEVKVGSASYFNIDHGTRFPQTALGVTPQGKLQAIPRTIDNIETYTPALTSRPTSLDTESKLIGVIRGKYPDPKELDSITIATTMAPCNSCAVVMKQFGYDGSPDALNVTWK